MLVGLKDAPWDDTAKGNVSIERIEYYLVNGRAAISRLESTFLNNSLPNNLLGRNVYTEIFRRRAVDPSLLEDFLCNHLNHLYPDYTLSLRALASADGLYTLLPNTIINLKVTSRPLHTMKWVSKPTPRRWTTHSCLPCDIPDIQRSHASHILSLAHSTLILNS